MSEKYAGKDPKKVALKSLISHMGGAALKKRKPDLAIYISGAPHGASAYTEEGEPEESDEVMNSPEAVEAHQEGEREDKDPTSPDGSDKHEDAESKEFEEEEQYDEDGDDDPIARRIKEMRKFGRK